MFPGQGPVFLDNRMTTVKRVFRRILPALIPADPTENLTPEQRFQELLEILRDSKHNRLWLAVLLDPAPGAESSPGSSLDLAAESIGAEGPGEPVAPEVLQDELRILLGFWLEMPLAEYLDDLESVGPAVAAAVRQARPSGLLRRPGAAAPAFNLRGLVDGSHPPVSAIPHPERKLLYERLKTFAKRVHRAARRQGEGSGASGGGRRENSLPFEIAQVLYNLAGALALTRCEARIVGLSDGQFRKNIAWVLNQSWLDARLRPIFFAALSQLGPAGSS
jgi:hypothetical protein